MSLLDEVRSLGIDSPIGAMVDPIETLRFIEWLPDLEWFEAYVALLLIRSKGLKERYGFKGSDHKLRIDLVPGFLDDPKLRLYLVLRRMALLAGHADQVYIYERHTNSGIEYYKLFPPLVTVMVCPNPTNWVTASINTVTDFVKSLYAAVMNPERAGELVRRIDVRLGPNAMKRTERMYHMIDVDDHSLFREVLGLVQEYLGYRPAYIETPRGGHVLVWVSGFDRDTARRWFPEVPKKLKRMAEEYGDEKVIEYKKDFQEPAPGVRYRGDFVPRFHPEER